MTAHISVTRISLKERTVMQILKFAMFIILVALFCSGLSAGGPLRTENLILITLDGVRLEEMFGGLDVQILRSLVNKKTQVEEHSAYKKYWAPSAQERREKVMPFFWGTLMREHGSIAGNRSLGSTVELTNHHRFSYPGYSEILTGQARDEEIDSNDKRRNPFPTVLEFVKDKLQLDSPQVAVFASWDTMSWIAEHQEGALTINAGFEEYDNPAVARLNKLQFETLTPWDSVRHDFYTFRFALAHLERFKPRMLYLGLGETDDWAHDKHYARVLDALNQTDQRLQELWEFLEKDPAYQGKTTILMTTDHGRGHTPKDWSSHGKKIEGAQYIWLAVISPDVRWRGEWMKSPTIFQNQIAATLCEFLGLNYKAVYPEAGSPILGLFEGAVSQSQTARDK